MKPKVAIVRGKFLNQFEMQFFEPLVDRFDLTAFGSLTPFHDQFAFPTVKLPSPMDLPDFPYKMPILNRLFVDAHYLWGLEARLAGFDLVHSAETYYHYTQQALRAKKVGLVKKVIATVLENIPHNNEGIWGRRAFKERARAELDHMIALSQKTKDALIAEGADPKKISVVNFYVDSARFAPRKDWLNRLGDEKKKAFTILFVGRLEQSKGVFELIKSMQQLSQDRTLRTIYGNVIFVGGGSERAKIEQQFQTVSKNWHLSITSAKYLDIPTFYRDADIFVAPSRSTATWTEQYGVVLLEAQAAGLPIVTTRSGSIPENVGDAAMMVPEGNSEELAGAIKKFLLDAKLRTMYAKRARDRAVRVHDKLIGAKKLQAVYEQVLSE